MRKWGVLWGASLVVVLAFSGCQRAEEVGEATPTPILEPAEATPTPTPVAAPGAAAQLAGPDGAKGIVSFAPAAGGGVQVVARIEGAKPGTHGLHVHAGGVCAPPGFESAGDHFNPTGGQHGGPDVAGRHAGDLGNIEIDASGAGNLSLTTDLLALEGDNGVIGKTVVLHEKADDLATQPSGNSGPRVACGVVEAVTATAPAAPAETSGAAI